MLLFESLVNIVFMTQASSEKIKFYAFVLETFGGFGKESVKFLKKISKLQMEHSSGNNTSRTSLITKSLSILLQRGNALVQLTGSQVAREAAGTGCGY